MPPAIRSFDPLVRPTGSKAAQLVRTVVLLLAAIGLHAFMLTAIFAANRAASSLDVERLKNEKIKVTVIEPPPPPPPPPVEPPEKTTDPAEAEPPPPPPKKKPPPPPPPKKKAPPPPPDPIDVPKDPPPEPKKPQPRRIAGLSLESTVSGSGGPSFAVGNTRMGKTAKTAEDASDVRKLDKTAPEPRENRRATRIPGTGKGKVLAPSVKGRRIRPEFPPLLKAQGIEGSVTVEVRIDKSGRVTKARIVEASRFEEFRTAALKAARAQRWSPASQGGKPIPYTLTYTYRFRIRD